MGKLPSLKALSRVFRDPKRARAILSMPRAELIAQCPAAAGCEFISPLYVLRLAALAAIEPGVPGVESFWTREGEHVVYLDAGYAYGATLIYRDGRYFVGNWGDISEQAA